MWGGFAGPCASPGGSSEARGDVLEVGVGAGRTGSSWWGKGGGEWCTGSESGARRPSCALRGLHCGWERPFHAFLGPH